MILKIEDIENSKNKTMKISFNDYIEGLDLTAPLVANLEVSSMGEFIKVIGHVSGCANLTCDLCLEKYEYNIDLDIDEMFAKNSLYEEYSQETEIKEGQFITDLENADELDISDVLYQSVILDFPNKKVCGINCNGGDIFQREEESQEKDLDPRMAIFKDLDLEKVKKPKSNK